MNSQLSLVLYSVRCVTNWSEREEQFISRDLFKDCVLYGDDFGRMRYTEILGAWSALGFNCKFLCVITNSVYV